MLIEGSALSPEIIPIPNGVKGEGSTTRFWDCCKPACSWKENINSTIKKPVASCDSDGKTPINIEAQSACMLDGGESFICSNQQPFVVNASLAYGFAGVSLKGDQAKRCCSCLLLNFKGKLAGKSMLVQYTTTGGDLTHNRFDIPIPGGGIGENILGCQRQWNVSGSVWGDRYGGVYTSAECAQLPKALQDGCRFRFNFMEGVSNPDVTFYEVKCPAELVAITGCELDS